jgi:hypothetical protein
MKMNADFEQRIVVHSARMPWLDSPMPGVSRRPLDRVGDEVARATSIVRYAPNSKFSPHVHTGGEEIVVLEGVFQDEHGDFPAGSYIRNPPQSSHTPGSDAGCVIFVKLWQFDPDDPTHVRLNPNFLQAIPAADYPGVSITPLYMDEAESVSIHHWQPSAVVDIDLPGGAEVLVLDGEFTEAGEVLLCQSWLRLPCDSKLHASAGLQGAKVWLKQGHMNRVDQEVARLP